MSHRVTAIVSTAADGAESGAINAAIDLALGYGGWTSDPGLPDIYAAHARPARDRDLAVRLNVQDSDGTLIVTFAAMLTGRALCAGNVCKQQGKPAKHLVLPARGHTRIRDDVRSALLDWIDTKRIGVLHVVGPGEDAEPGIAQATRDALVWVLEDAIPVIRLPERPAPLDGVQHSMCPICGIAKLLYAEEIRDGFCSSCRRAGASKSPAQVVADAEAVYACGCGSLTRADQHAAGCPRRAVGP